MENSTQRPGSIRSVASNSSISSGVSLSRRPRTRTRSRTVGASSRSEDPPQNPTESILPYLNNPVVKDSSEEEPTVVKTPVVTPPIHPPSSSEQRISDTASSLEPAAADATAVDPPQTPNTGKQVHLIPLLCCFI